MIDQEKQYIGFELEENYVDYMKSLKHNSASSFNSMSAIIRHCIKKQLPILLDEAGIEYRKK